MNSGCVFDLSDRAFRLGECSRLRVRTQRAQLSEGGAATRLQDVDQNKTKTSMFLIITTNWAPIETFPCLRPRSKTNPVLSRGSYPCQIYLAARPESPALSTTPGSPAEVPVESLDPPPPSDPEFSVVGGPFLTHGPSMIAWVTL